MASPKPASLGRSLTLWELAKEPMLANAVPQKYVLLDQEPSTPSPGTTTLPKIPLIDMEQLTTVDEEITCSDELDKLHSVCKEWGVFQLVNHGVSSSLMEKLKYEIEEFYDRPLEEKMRYRVRPGDVEGYGQTILVQEGQKVDWADRFYMITNPIHTRKPHLLPEFPPSLRDTLECYVSELQRIAMTLVGLMAKALKIEKREIEEVFEDGMQSVRMTYYPPCPQPEMVLGLTPHSDGSGITILHQLNGVDGLQVKKDGVWIPANILPDAFVVNVGDILEILSNGVYQSVEHKVTVNSVEERISIAMFFKPKLEAEFGPAASLVTPQNPPLFKRLGMKDYVKGFFSQGLNGKSFLEQMKIKDGEDNATT